MTAPRIALVVLDGAGVGEMPDAEGYGDVGSNTLGNLAKHVGGLDVPNLALVGLGRVIPVEGVPPGAFRGPGAWGKSSILSPGKDTITGHWEMMGIILEHPFPTYPDGFPGEIMDAFERITGRKSLGNRVASGTEIIQEMGDRHVATGYPIVYTSADSVFQVAANEEVIPPEELYEICSKMRRVLTGRHRVGRVIARPFRGEKGSYWRTEGRKDFPADPPSSTVLDALSTALVPVTGVGKIGDIFNMRGVSRSIPTHSNREGLDALRHFLLNGDGFCFANLIDFDMLYGHRNDVRGYQGALAELDAGLAELLPLMRPGDLVMMTADHGCDPTFPGTDHTREYVPLLVRGGQREADLGTRETLADAGATIAERFGVDWRGPGTSFLGCL